MIAFLMVARDVSGLSLLRSSNSCPVYYVNSDNLVDVSGVSMYRTGFAVFEDNFDYDSYNSFFERNQFPPPLDSVADVRPNRKHKVPGIEIFAGGKLWDNHGEYYYLLVDHYGIDSNMTSQYGNVVRRNTYVRAKVSHFLETELFSELKQSRRAYEKRIVSLINRYLKRPENTFSLRVLGEDEAKFVRFDEIDLQDALKQNVRLDIDWMLASGILGLYGSMSKKR